jgi:hypothetical protein
MLTIFGGHKDRRLFLDPRMLGNDEGVGSLTFSIVTLEVGVLSGVKN